MLDSNGDSLYYFKNKKERQNVHAMPEQIPISLVKKIVFEGSVGAGVCFDLELMSGHLYALRASSKAEAAEWVSKISNLKAKNEADSRQSNEDAFAEEIQKEKMAAARSAQEKAASARVPRMGAHMKGAARRKSSIDAILAGKPLVLNDPRRGPLPPGPPPRPKVRTKSMVKSSGRMSRLAALKQKKLEAAERARSSLTAVSEVGGAGGVAAHGWTTDVDPTSGEVYYYHVETGETAWDRPASMDAGGDAAASGAPAAAPACPAGWEAHLDPHSQEHYYVNMATSETSWDVPAADHEAAQAAPTPPPGWEAHLDADSGAHYYVNSETGETSWDFPGEESPHVAAAHAGAAAAESGWTMHSDAESGHIFYVNDATGETKWAEP